MGLEPIVRSALGREQVYEYLRESILNGELKPNQKLIESHYTDKLQVSRTPIREALRMLEKDGLVEHIPQRGTYVRAPYSLGEIKEMFMIRRALQMVSIDSTIDNASQDDIDYMQQCLDESRRAILENDITAYVKHNNRFNHRLIESCRLPMLSAILVQMERYNPGFSFLEEATPSATFLSQKHRCELALGEHMEILVSIQQRDRERLRETLDRHILNTKEAYLYNLKNGQSNI